MVTIFSFPNVFFSAFSLVITFSCKPFYIPTLHIKFLVFSWFSLKKYIKYNITILKIISDV